LRENRPVYQVEGFGFWAVSRYEDVVHVLKSPDLFSSTAMGAATIAAAGDLAMRARTVINSDPPDHTRLRNLVNRAFTPRMVADLQPRIRDISKELIASMIDSAEAELVSGLAVPLPVVVIAEILGVEPERHQDFKRWSDAIVAAMSGTASQETLQQLQTELEQFSEYFERVMAERRNAPRNDMISALVRAADEDQALTVDEVRAFAALLLVAGNETTTNLISNAVLALIEHPKELARVRADRSLIANLVEETLRYDAPVQFLFRNTTADVEVADTTIPKGSIVLPIFASGNRDERKYPDPDRFDITRNAQGHLAFGLGIHFCLGAPLARLEAKVAMEELLSVLPDLEPAGAHERLESPFLRGLTRLPLHSAAVDERSKLAVQSKP